MTGMLDANYKMPPTFEMALLKIERSILSPFPTTPAWTNIYPVR